MLRSGAGKTTDPQINARAGHMSGRIRRLHTIWVSMHKRGDPIAVVAPAAFIRQCQRMHRIHGGVVAGGQYRPPVSGDTNFPGTTQSM